MSTKNTSIRLDPKIKGLLDRIPEGFDKDFTDEQLLGLNIALGKRSWRDHPIDFRHSIGLLKWRYYFVFIAGRDLRGSRLQDRPLIKGAEVLFLTFLVIFMMLLGMLLAYLLKSALGIDILPNFSFGIWGWFKDSFL